jgi:hypothetical protein
MPALVFLPLALAGPLGWYVAYALCMKSTHYER